MEEKIKVVNVVASAFLDCKIPLNRLIRRLPGTEYEPEEFPGMIYRSPEGGVALIFSSGKIVCTGSKTEEGAKGVLKGIEEALKDMGIKPKRKEFKIENIVASAHLHKELNLNRIAFAFEQTEYAPEQFPGLIYHIREVGTTFLVFGSGRLVCTGGESIKEIEKSVKIIKEELRKGEEFE